MTTMHTAMKPMLKANNSGRVRKRHCCRFLPSEPDVKVSPHPAQAVAKSRANGAGQRGNFSRDLDDMHLQPADWTRTLEPVGLVRLCRPAGGCTHGLRHAHLLFPPAQVLRVFSPSTTRWKSARLHGGTMLQSLSDPLQSGLCFFQHPLPVTSTAHRAMTPASPLRRDVGFILFRCDDMDDLVPVTMPAAVVSVCSKAEMEQPAARLLARACQRLWLFGSDGTFHSSPGLDLSSSLTLRPPLTLAVAETPHGALLAPMNGGMLSRQLSTRPLPVAPMPIG